jgi:hypothetical protein
MRTLPLAWVAVSLALPGGVLAQTPASGVHDHAAAPTAQVVRLTESIRIDGVLDEAAWREAPAMTEFTQIVPIEGAPATERTEVRFLYDDVALYIGARMYDRSPVTTRLGRRDMPMGASDWLTIIFDSYHDHRTAFGFEVNPSGVRRDQTRTVNSEDDSWDPVWEVATSIDEEGWTAEIRIPFSQLRFNPLAEQVWGLQVERQIARNREFSVFAFTPTTEPAGIPRFGHLHGMENLSAGKRLEVLPYTVLRADAADRSGNPFRDDREVGGSAGVDLKYRVTSDLTLDLTVNPDFGQVEVDPAQVNLSAIETHYDEKRPFFVEGSEIFAFGAGGGNQAFYSRRIGRSPQMQPQGPADLPEVARILGAAKLTGRTGGGWTIGVLNALTRREEALFRNTEGDDARMAVEPLTNYFAGRVRRDVRGGLTVLGGMFTAVNRDLDSDLMSAQLRSAAYTGGIDFRHEWAERNWVVSGFLSGSHVEGSGTAIRIAQTSPWRYFQRPDAEHLELDPSRTSLTGMAGQAQLQYRRGRHWRYTLVTGTTSPQYEVNDIGFQYRADRVDAQAAVTYVEPRPGSVLRNWQVQGVARAERNYAFETIMNRVALSGSGQFLNYWSGAFSVARNAEALDDRLTRGGPSSLRPPLTQVNVNLSTDGRRRVSGGGGLGGSWHTEGGWGYGGGVGVTVRPAPSWNVSLSPAFERAHNVAQYRGMRADPTATHTYGARYLFSSLDQTTVSLETRLDVTVSPSLSLQVYAQPFISSGDFGDLAELRAPGEYDFQVYGRDIGEVEGIEGGVRVFPQGREGAAAPFTTGFPDFTIRSLRGNAVLRWEYRPGSTIYVAWQQNRSSALTWLDAGPDAGRFDFSRDRGALFSTRPDNVLLLKVSYWLNP